MAAKQSIVGLHFQGLVDNLDIEEIAPLMSTVGILSTKSEVELKSKGTRKQQVRFIIKEVKQHPSGDDLFKDCLQRSNHLQGHQKLLSLLYSAESSYTGMYSNEH